MRCLIVLMVVLVVLAPRREHGGDRFVDGSRRYDRCERRPRAAWLPCRWAFICGARMGGRCHVRREWRQP